MFVDCLCCWMFCKFYYVSVFFNFFYWVAFVDIISWILTLSSFRTILTISCDKFLLSSSSTLFNPSKTRQGCLLYWSWSSIFLLSRVDSCLAIASSALSICISPVSELTFCSRDDILLSLFLTVAFNSLISLGNCSTSANWEPNAVHVGGACVWWDAWHWWCWSKSFSDVVWTAGEQVFFDLFLVATLFFPDMILLLSWFDVEV